MPFDFTWLTKRKALLGSSGRAAGIRTARLTREGAHLISQLLDLRGERTHLRFEAIEPNAVGTAAAIAGAAGCRSGTAATASQRFERADHDLHVDELLLELFDAFLESGILTGLRCRRFRLGLSLRRCLLRQKHRGTRRLGDRCSRHKAGETGATENRNEGALRAQWAT